MTNHEPILLLGEVPFHPRQREWWRRSCELRKEWAENYEFLFDAHDVRLVESQGPLGYHFFEWLGAITLFHSTGYWSLQGKYEFPKHATKSEVTAELLPKEVCRIIRTRPRRAQCPDLLVLRLTAPTGTSARSRVLVFASRRVSSSCSRLSLRLAVGRWVC